MSNKYTFGPINSRRFGLSLGIDLSPDTKQCNFDCLYCELEGVKATSKQTKIAPFLDIIAEIKIALTKYPNIDVLTITANGEPTMYPYLHKLLEQIKIIQNNNHQKIQTLILSNASMINNEIIQNALLDIDIVKLSLDSVDEKIFKKIDRAYSDISINDIKQGILKFSKIYKKQLVIEILFVKNINDKIEHIKNINEFLLILKPHRIDISTIDRPPAYEVESLSNKELLEIVNHFSDTLNISIAYNRKKINFYNNFSKEEILNMLKRRPQSLDDVNMIFSQTSKEILNALLKEKRILQKKVNNNTFYVLAF